MGVSNGGRVVTVICFGRAQVTQRLQIGPFIVTLGLAEPAVKFEAAGKGEAVKKRAAIASDRRFPIR